MWLEQVWNPVHVTSQSVRLPTALRCPASASTIWLKVYGFSCMFMTVCTEISPKGKVSDHKGLLLLVHVYAFQVIQLMFISVL